MVVWYALLSWMSANHSSFNGVYCADLPEVDTGNAFLSVVVLMLYSLDLSLPLLQC